MCCRVSLVTKYNIYTPVYLLQIYYRKSASCTHVSAVLHALAGLNPAPFQLQPPFPSATDEPDDDEEVVPVTSLPCVWKQPKGRKDSSLLVSQTHFERHEHSKPVKRKFELLEEFDPRPVEFRGSARSNLPKLLNEVEGKKLCISLLLDPTYSEEKTTTQQPDDYSIPSVSDLKSTIEAFKKSLEVSHDEARKIERDTRDQRMSSTWFSLRRYRLTASNFGAAISRKSDTPPDKLVLQILRPTNFTSAAIQHGIQNEKLAINAYVDYQQRNGHPDILVTQSGFIVNPLYPF